MNKQINKATEDALKNFQNAEATKLMRDFVLDGVNKSQDASNKWAAFCKDLGKTYEGLFMKAAANARTINEKVLENTALNTKAALDHAAKVVKAGDVNAAAKSQIEFVRKQVEVINDQQVELFDLSNAITKDMAEAGTSAANAAVEQVKAAA